MKLKNFLFRNIFFQYKKFFSYDVEFSLLCNRNFTYIDAIRMLLLPIYTDTSNHDMEEEKQKELTKQIQKLHENIASTCVNQFQSFKQKIYESDVDDEFEKTFQVFYTATQQKMKMFLLVYEMVYRIEANKHEGMLVELNNALSHILSYMYDTSKQKINIDKANDHLTRGVLDGIKAILVHYKDNIIENEDFIKKLIELRVLEAKSIGSLASSDTLKKYIVFIKNINMVKGN